MDKITPEKAMKELTMILMYLSRFSEDSRFASALDLAWKGYDFDIINELDEEDYIRQGSYRSKSVAITEEGIKLAQNLLREEPLEMTAGCGYKIDIFLGYFFIRKCMWSTPGTIKTTAASIKKFYKSMSEHGYISKDRYKDLCDVIKENMEIWQGDCEAFNNYY